MKVGDLVKRTKANNLYKVFNKEFGYFGIVTDITTTRPEKYNTETFIIVMWSHGITWELFEEIEVISEI